MVNNFNLKWSRKRLFSLILVTPRKPANNYRQTERVRTRKWGAPRERQTFRNTSFHSTDVAWASPIFGLDSCTGADIEMCTEFEIQEIGFASFRRRSTTTTTRIRNGRDECKQRKIYNIIRMVTCSNCARPRDTYFAVTLYARQPRPTQYPPISWSPST